MYSRKQLIKSAALLMLGTACVTQVSVAFADDEDIFTVGPTAKQTFSVSDSRYSMHENQYDNVFNVVAGGYTENYNAINAAGTFGVTENLSLNVELTDLTSYNTTYTWYDYRNSRDQSGKVGNAVGASYRVYGDAAVASTSMFVTLQTGNDGLGYGQWVNASVNPQFRLSPTWLATLNLGTEHQQGQSNYSWVGGNLLWNVAPKVTVQLFATEYLTQAGQGYSSTNGSQLAASATYHFDHHWSAWGELEGWHGANRNTSVYINDLTDRYSSQVTIGVRYTM